jgi:5-methylcytosine-specific restriction protein A
MIQRADPRSPQALVYRSWYGTARWQKLRAKIKRNYIACAICRRSRFQGGVKFSVDHIRPHKGDPKLFWEETNLQLLCDPCHLSAKAKAEGDRGRPSKAKEIGLDGWPVQ